MNNREKILIMITFILAIIHMYYGIIIIGTVSIMIIAGILCLATKEN